LFQADPAKPAAKRLRLSRNKKKTWRKLSRDVDNLLPEQTTAELIRRRSGGFFIDVGEPGQRRRQSRQQQQQAKVEGSGSSATSRILSGLRCHESLPSGAASAPVAESKRQKKFNSRPLDRLVKHAAAADQDKAAGPQTMDLWGSDPKPESSADTDIKDLVLHQMRCTRQAPVKRRFRTGTSSAPACPVPQPGASYNPSLADHEAMLAAATQSELVKESRAKRLHGQMERHFPGTAGAAAALAAANDKEMAAGLFESDSEGEGDDIVDKEVDDSTPSEPPPVAKSDQPAGRTSSKQNAEVRRQRAQAAELKRRKRQSVDLDRLTELSRQVGRSLAAGDRQRQARLAKRRERASGTKRLGRHRFEEPEAEFKLADELAPSLRQLRPEGDLFVDAVKSYQRRSMLEPRSRTAWRRKYPHKRYRKKGLEASADGEAK
uniref:Ribosome biogenesis protein NOP53 n=2 Tax=Macrostomum lignano TaxID=282301 RepID=A0A1I8HCQ6_9PLAT